MNTTEIAQLEEQARRNRCRHATKMLIKSGELVRPSVCDQCPNTGQIDAHHQDYNDPRNVTWLCKSCHNKINGSRRHDRAVPKVPTTPIPKTKAVKIAKCPDCGLVREMTTRINCERFQPRNIEGQIIYRCPACATAYSKKLNDNQANQAISMKTVKESEGYLKSRLEIELHQEDISRNARLDR